MDKYTIEEWVGRGSYGSVARIRRKQDNQVRFHFEDPEEATTLSLTAVALAR